MKSKLYPSNQENNNDNKENNSKKPLNQDRNKLKSTYLYI